MSGPSGSALCTADRGQMATMCLSEFFVSDGAVSETNPEWIARGVFAADALTGASITGPSPHRRLRMQSLQNRNPSVIQWYGQKQL